MDEKYRDNGVRTADRAVTSRRDDDHDDLSRRREQNQQQERERPSLTPREREERWPIG